MINMKYLLLNGPRVACGILLMGIGSVAHAFDIPQSVANGGLRMAFPRDVKGFHVHDPVITFNEGNAIFCAIAKPKLLPKEINFCASVVPEWRPETGTLHAKDLQLTSLQLDGLTEANGATAKSSINTMLLPFLGEIQLAKAPDWVGKRVSALKVKPGKISIEF